MSAPAGGAGPLAGAGHDLSGRVAVVTGGGRGIGLGIARGLAAHGALVVVCGRDPATLEAAVAAIDAEGGRAEARTADMADEEQVKALAATVLARHGRVDALVNNAGVNPYFKPSEHTPLAEWSHLIAVNLTGVFLGCREFGRAMLEAGRGSIVNVTSVAARVGLARGAAYCAAKGGVEAMTRSLALDWAPKGVRVNCLAPGYVETDLTAGMRANEGLSAALMAKTPLGRFGTAGDMAGAALFLASDASLWMTGQSLVVDGGWTTA